MHSTYSDGRDALASMVEALPRARVPRYMAITDHSSGAAASRTLARHDIAHQLEEIEELRERFPGMTILHGIEVDILPDGRLDFEDALLEQFDIVLASLHDHARQDADRLTRRSLAALRHPLVNVLCHPANQLVGHFEGYRAGLRRALCRGGRDRHGARDRRGAQPHGSRRQHTRARRRPQA